MRTISRAKHTTYTKFDLLSRRDSVGKNISTSDGSSPCCCAGGGTRGDPPKSKRDIGIVSCIYCNKERHR